mmetsp:Transcript_24318/g.51750  ORF Transcript_24318/g.51750 Transcript_24318/m.51750 type:complete len:136 (+) Transcript_24318:342-749(+)
MRPSPSTFSISCLVLVVVLLLSDGTRCSVAEVSTPSCANYTKGEFGPDDIVDEDSCRSACETAEGLPVGDYNREEGSDYATCTCVKKDPAGGSASETRGLCEDGEPGSGAGHAALGTAARVALALGPGVFSAWLL